jgi:hypothetical protein
VQISILTFIVFCLDNGEHYNQACQKGRNISTANWGKYPSSEKVLIT